MNLKDYIGVSVEWRHVAPYQSILGVMLKWYNDADHPDVGAENDCPPMRFLQVRFDVLRRVLEFKIQVNKFPKVIR